MGVQYAFASENKEYRSTYVGKAYHVDEKINRDPQLKKRVPKRWISSGWIEEVDKKEV